MGFVTPVDSVATVTVSESVSENENDVKIPAFVGRTSIGFNVNIG